MRFIYEIKKCIGRNECIKYLLQNWFLKPILYVYNYTYISERTIHCIFKKKGKIFQVKVSSFQYKCDI